MPIYELMILDDFISHGAYSITLMSIFYYLISIFIFTMSSITINKVLNSYFSINAFNVINMNLSNFYNILVVVIMNHY